MESVNLFYSTIRELFPGIGLFSIIEIEDQGVTFQRILQILPDTLPFGSSLAIIILSLFEFMFHQDGKQKRPEVLDFRAKNFRGTT